MKTTLPEVSASQLAGVSSRAEETAIVLSKMEATANFMVLSLLLDDEVNRVWLFRGPMTVVAARLVYRHVLIVPDLADFLVVLQ